MNIVKTVSGFKRELSAARRRGRKIHFVPTMGALHEGHLALVRAAGKKKAFVAVSIFVNPLQFGPGEDFSRYPRDVKRDARLLRTAGADLLFAPSSGEMLDPEQTVFVNEEKASKRWCGRYRPGHFRGVLTIVAKLFHLAQPDAAFFGQKDFQQWFLIRKMVRELQFPCEVIRVPTVREPDGLAMSSRNAYLKPNERRDATGLVEGLRMARHVYGQGGRKSKSLQSAALMRLRHFPGLKVQYIGVAGGKTLDPVEQVKKGDVMLVAGFVGKTRLIDNWILGEAL